MFQTTNQLYIHGIFEGKNGLENLLATLPTHVFPMIMCLGSSIRSSLASHFVDPKPSLTTGYRNFVKFIN